jgi:hypothetical protein
MSSAQPKAKSKKSKLTYSTTSKTQISTSFPSYNANKYKSEMMAQFYNY